MREAGQIRLPKGFSFGAAKAGIKASGKPDLGLILAVPSTSAAALFTRNLIVAAPITIGRTSLGSSMGRIRAVLVNSGNANCATGTRGIRACKDVCADTAKLLGVSSKQVFPSSTGIIGVQLPTTKILSQLPFLVNSCESSLDHLQSFAEAILTTDSHPKLANASLSSGVAITGVAKGAGMIHPQLATMLVYILTDVVVSPAELRKTLQSACRDTFNVISIDGDTSTNDTVLLLASGASGIKLRDCRDEFQASLNDVCRSLAEQIVADGEGVQHVIRLHVNGARTRGEALQVARTIAHSLLVKTAWAGADPNWGRILAAIGRSGIPVNPGKVSVMIGDQTVCRGAVAYDFDVRRAHEELSKPESRVEVCLGRGKSEVEFLTTDLTSEYVKINADYST
jgi:glutamate N-acetyltransferase / amino-acid N-acetyltransferase